MLEKIVSILSIGKFIRYLAHAGDTAFRAVTLIYAENARGKTTLCAILRSLRRGNATSITERATLGASAAPRVELRINATNASFRDGAWNTTVPDIEVFDDAFVQITCTPG